ncbi:chemotaxis protein, partial [Brevundimonas vesicularis]|nr:chemotaxis protein [Brevundimonas vesicularis]
QQMDQVTQQNAAMVEQSTAASLSLSREAAELADLVGRFETSQVAAAPTAVHKAQARVESFARAHAAPARARMASGRSGPALAVVASSWEEF